MASTAICLLQSQQYCQSLSSFGCEINNSFAKSSGKLAKAPTNCNSLLTPKAFQRVLFSTNPGSKNIVRSGLSGSLSAEVSILKEENLNLRSARRKLGVVKLAVVRMSGIENEEITGQDRPFAVLFVCLGNICRSPTAEAVFTHAVKSKGLTSNYRIDSAGTINYHEGDPADARMRGAASKRGVKLTSISRPIRPVDFEEFDLILAMDRQNYADILAAHRNWSNKYSLPSGSENKVKLMCSYCRTFEFDEVPDPYYGGPEGFEQVLDLLEDACGGLLESLELQGQTLQT